VTVVLRDDGGTASGGVDVSQPQSFTITVHQRSPWHNIANALDVDADTLIAPIDALTVINYLNAPSPAGPGAVPQNADIGPSFYDVDDDWFVVPVDALIVINYLNANHAASMAESVSFANRSAMTDCAEDDNITIPVQTTNDQKGIASFDIEATHPDYAFETDNGAPDFRNCQPASDPVYNFTPKTVVLFDNHVDTVIQAVTEPQFWRPLGMTVHVESQTATDVHYLRIIKRIPGTDSWPEVAVYYADGYLRTKPFPPVGRTDVFYGTSVLVGPAIGTIRPYADVREVDFMPLLNTLNVGYRAGGGASMNLTEISRDKTTVHVVADFDNGPAVPAATIRSMFVADGNADADHIRWTDGQAAAHDEAIMSFMSGTGTAIQAARETLSIHNTSAPSTQLKSFKVTNRSELQLL
jgi:hypothetical protein